MKNDGLCKRQNKGLSPKRRGDADSQDAYRPQPLRYEDYMDWDDWNALHARTIAQEDRA